MSEVERYDKAWATGEYVPLIGLEYVRAMYRLNLFNNIKNLLDVGCGAGVAVAYHREIGKIDAFGIDFTKYASSTWEKLDVSKWCSVAAAEAIPYKDNQFEMVTCTDVLEHIPEENVKTVLEEMFRVGNDKFLFTIALTQAKKKMPHDGSEPHICVKEPGWWFSILDEVGYKYEHAPAEKGPLWISNIYNKNQIIWAEDTMMLRSKKYV
jgi:ubiquinone/menaquinone biosynthesis C-methylase UbiE